MSTQQQSTPTHTRSDGLASVALPTCGAALRTAMILASAARGVAARGLYAEIEGLRFVSQLEALQIPEPDTLKALGVLPILLADLDGTFIRDASGIAVADAYIAQGLVMPEVLPEIRRLSPLFGGSDLGMEVSQAAKLLINDYERWVATDKASDPEALSKTHEMYSFLAYLYAGRTDLWVQEFAATVFERQGFWGQVFAESRPLIDTMRSKGIRTALISASPNPVATVVGRHLGIGPELVRGVPLAFDSQGMIVPRRGGPLPFREGKVHHAREILVQEFGMDGMHHTPLFAIGDTPGKTDQNLLEMPVATLVAEPQTPNDYRKALQMAADGRAVVVIDFRRTVNGEAANRFDLRGAAYEDHQLRHV